MWQKLEFYGKVVNINKVFQINDPYKQNYKTY